MIGHVRQLFALRVSLGLVGIACVFALVISLYVIVLAYLNTVDLAGVEAGAALEAVGGAGAVAAGKSTGLTKAINSFVGSRARPERDHFIIARVYDRNRKPIAETKVPGVAFLVAGMERSADRFPEMGGRWSDTRILDGQVYIHVVIPVAEGTAGVVGYIEGVFKLSRQTLFNVFSVVRELILKTVAISICAGVATAQLLYPIVKEQQRRLIEAALQLLNENILSLKLLGNAIAKRDSDTHVHNFRVTIYSVRLAEALSRGKTEIQDLIKGAFLHDVGKIGIPDAILLKQGALTDREFTEMRRHVDYGTEIIDVSDWLKGAKDVVQYHHEKFDGSGYPKGLKGKNIPINARIFAVADVFDALTSRRPYKEPWPLEEAQAKVEEGRGAHFDPDVLDAFMRISDGMFTDITSRDDAAIEAHLDDQIKQYFGL